MTRWLLVLAGCSISLGLATSASSEQVKAIRLDGSVVQGNLSRIEDRIVAIESTSGMVEVRYEDLDRVTIERPSEPTNRVSNAQETVVLIDGSKVICRAFAGRDDRWNAISPTGKALEFAKGSVESLLMQSLSPTVRQEWTRIQAEPRTGDEMVIARKGDAIDRASGMIISISPEAIEFSFDGQVLQAPRSKLVGLLWFRSQEKRVEPAIQVRTDDGSQWEAIALSIDDSPSSGGGGLRWTTPCGVEATEVWQHLTEINFSAANVVWLASQAPLSKKTWERSIIKDAVIGRDALLGPRFASTDGSDDAKAQDLHFLAPGEIAFRVPSGFRRFVAKVKRAEKAQFSTSLQCQVWVGDDLAWEATLPPGQLEANVDIPVVADKRLRITVGSDSDLQLGTQLSWQQPRLTR